MEAEQVLTELRELVARAETAVRELTALRAAMETSIVTKRLVVTDEAGRIVATLQGADAVPPGLTVYDPDTGSIAAQLYTCGRGGVLGINAGCNKPAALVGVGPGGCGVFIGLGPGGRQVSFCVPGPNE